MNLNLDELKKLQQKKYRHEFGCFLAEGEHLALELEKAALHKPTLRTSELYVTEEFQHWATTLRKQVITDKQMAQICDTQTPQGIVALVPIAALQLGQATPHSATGEKERSIYLHDMQGCSLSAKAFKECDCYLFGNEARGVPHEQLQKLGAQPFAIPGSGAIESLNLATVVNMCAYELNRRP